MTEQLPLLTALLALLGLTFFIYFCYPKSWKKMRRLKCVLFVFHGIGSVTLAVVFTCYNNISFDWMKWFVSCFGTAYLIIIVLLSVLFALRISVVGIITLISRIPTAKHPRFAIYSFYSSVPYSVIAIFLSVTIAFIGMINIDYVRVKKYNLFISKDCSEKELDIVMMSDIHAGAGTWKQSYEDLIGSITEINPDIILLGGDIFDETTSQRDVQYVVTMLDKLSPKYGTYYVCGNHDNELPNEVIQALSEVGVTVMKDNVTVIGKDIQLIGRLDPSTDAQSPEELLSANNIEQSLPIIILQHRPVDLQKLSDNGCDLAFSGHTHGFSIPFGLYVTLANDMVSGSRRYNDMTAITSAGVSAWGIHYKWPAQSDIIHAHIIFGEYSNE